MGCGMSTGSIRLGAAILLVVLPVLAGCVAAPAGAGAGGATDPDTSVTATVDPSATPTPTPAPTLAPDAFWGWLFNGEPEAVSYSSLDAMIKDSGLVLLGSFADVTAGPDSDAGSGPTNYMATIDLKVAKVLRGTLPADASGTVAVVTFLGTGPTGAVSPYTGFIANLKASMPNERGVFFLENPVAYYSRFDPTAKERYDPTVYQVTSVQGLFRDAAGVAQLPATASGSWITTYAGKPFDTVVAQLSSACGNP